MLGTCLGNLDDVDGHVEGPRPSCASCVEQTHCSTHVQPCTVLNVPDLLCCLLSWQHVEDPASFQLHLWVRVPTAKHVDESR